jgi:hypothetical protein
MTGQLACEPAGMYTVLDDSTPDRAGMNVFVVAGGSSGSGVFKLCVQTLQPHSSGIK